MWSRLHWTAASQILAALDGEEAAEVKAEFQDPKGYFDGLVADGALERAVSYLGIALPNLEAVHWAWTALNVQGRTTGHEWRDRIRASAERWIGDPTDGNRRSVWAIATERDTACPEKLLAGAIFFSGGSIAPDGVPSVEPPPAVCGKLAACAIIAAAHASSARESALRAAIASGDHIAEAGLRRS
jgi:hypothetical protein